MLITLWSFWQGDRSSLKTRACRSGENYNDGEVDASYIGAMRTQSRTLFENMRTDRAEWHDRKERGRILPPRGDAAL